MRRLESGAGGGSGRRVTHTRARRRFGAPPGRKTPCREPAERSANALRKARPGPERSRQWSAERRRAARTFRALRAHKAGRAARRSTPLCFRIARGRCSTRDARFGIASSRELRDAMPTQQGAARAFQKIGRAELCIVSPVIPGRAKGANPESISPVCGYGFRLSLASLARPE